jgi:quinol monooxygenase YgiN
MVLFSDPGGMSLRVGRPKQYSVDIWGRTITVLETWADQDQQDVEAIRDKIAAFVRELGGLLLQQKIAASLKGRYNVTESVTAPNKALVLKMRL